MLVVLLFPLLLSACDAFGLSCGATGYKAKRYFTDRDMLAVAEEINCGRVPSEELIEAVKPKVNDEANKNMTLLWWAYHAKDPASFEALVKAGADATIPLNREDRRLIPIHTIVLDSADSPEYLAMLEIYLKYGGNPDFVAHKSMSPAIRPSLLDQTAVHGIPDAARLLLRYGADPNRRAEGSALFPLESAIGHFEVFKLIYEAGGDWERTWRSDYISKRDKVPITYSHLCGYVYDNSPKEDRQSYHQVIQFLHEEGHEMPQLCLDRIGKEAHDG